jgi:hypothetical protein
MRFFIVGLIAMGVGELTNLVTESRAIRRIQDARSIADVPFQYVETPAENVGLHLSPRTLLALISGGCFVAGVTIVYRTRFFGHKFELSGLLHSGFLPGDTCVVRTA